MLQVVSNKSWEDKFLAPVFGKHGMLGDKSLQIYGPQRNLYLHLQVCVIKTIKTDLDPKSK